MIIFDNMIADMLSNEKRKPIVTELFIGDRKLNIYFAFITQSYYAVPKDMRINSTNVLLPKFQTNMSFNKSH